MKSTFRSKMLCFLIIFCQFAQYFALPDCTFEDSTCWTKVFKTISPKIADGIPELGIEKLDPIHFDFLELTKNGFFYESTNNTLSGLKGFIIEDISNYKDLKVMVLVFRANITFTGDYTLNGTFFLHPIPGHGKIKVSSNNCRFEMIMPYEVIKEKNGNGRISLKYYLFSSHAYGGINYNIGNLLPDRNDMSETIHTILNKNWRVFESDVVQKIFNLMISNFFKAFRAVVASYEIKLLIM